MCRVYVSGGWGGEGGIRRGEWAWGWLQASGLGWVEGRVWHCCWLPFVCVGRVGGRRGHKEEGVGVGLAAGQWARLGGGEGVFLWRPMRWVTDW